MGRNSPALWFDSWGNDLRDNDRDGTVDTGSEVGLSDGVHHGRTSGQTCVRYPVCRPRCAQPRSTRTVDVNYMVCIDIPIEAYRFAGVPISTSRWIPHFFGGAQDDDRLASVGPRPKTQHAARW